MSHETGEPVVGIHHSTNASAGVEIPIYNQGSTTARTLAPNEYLEINAISLVTAAGGDCYVVIGPDASVGTGETVLRGTYAANGGERKDYTRHSGGVQEAAYLTAPAGDVDVRFTGSVHRVGNDQTPDWRAVDFGQS